MIYCLFANDFLVSVTLIVVFYIYMRMIRTAKLIHMVFYYTMEYMMNHNGS